MKNSPTLPIVFIAISSFVFMLGAYVLATKTTLHPQFFITACGEVLKNIQEHAHFNLGGVLSSLILFIITISVSLALFQLVRFIVSSRRLHQFQVEEVLPDNLKEIVSKHDLPHNSVAVVENNKLAAYTIGLFKPKIVVSKAFAMKLSQEQLEAVVLHELYHLRSRHLFWLLFSRLVSSLFFFIPMIEYLAKQLRTEFELKADAFVVEKQKTRDHLCNSLALNLKYAGGVIPHFATTPIEKRVESLVNNRFFLERISLKQLGISLFSLGLMIGVAVIQPNQVVADFILENNAVCRVGKNCQTTDCANSQNQETHNLASLALASFSLSSSR